MNSLLMQKTVVQKFSQPKPQFDMFVKVLPFQFN